MKPPRRRGARAPQIHGRSRQNIHFLFDAHGHGQRFARPSSIGDAQFILVENAIGSSSRSTMDRHTEDNSIFAKSMFKIADRAGKKGVKFESVERVPFSFKGLKTLRSARKLGVDFERARVRALANPSVYSIKQFFLKFAAYNRLRHELIKGNILRRSKRGSAVIWLGGAHSLLSSELQQRGFSSSRETRRMVVSHYEELVRRLLRDPSIADKIPAIDYKRAFTDVRMYPYITAQTGSRGMMGITGHIAVKQMAVMRALSDSLPESVLDHALAQRSNARLARIIVEANGLPYESTFAQLEKFATPKSLFLKQGKKIHERRE